MFTRIFQVGSHANTQAMALHLSTQQASQGSALTIHHFINGQKNPFIKLNTDYLLEDKARELKNILFVGQTRRTALSGILFGEFTAETFAEHFDRAFVANPYHPGDVALGVSVRKHVLNIYLVGSEVGLSKKGANDSFAQKLANALYKKGFLCVTIHAVAYERQEEDESLYVDVTGEPEQKLQGQTQSGLITTQIIDAQRARAIQPILKKQENIHRKQKKRGFILNDMDLAIIASIEQEIARERLQAKLDGGILSEDGDIATILDRAENLFEPNETFEQRKKRIEEHLEYQPRQKFRKNQIEAMNMIRGLVVEIEENKKETSERKRQKLEFLTLVLTKMSEMKHTYQKICKFLKVKYEKLIAQNDLITKILTRLSGPEPKNENEEQGEKGRANLAVTVPLIQLSEEKDAEVRNFLANLQLRQALAASKRMLSDVNTMNSVKLVPERRPNEPFNFNRLESKGEQKYEAVLRSVEQKPQLLRPRAYRRLFHQVYHSPEPVPVTDIPADIRERITNLIQTLEAEIRRLRVNLRGIWSIFGFTQYEITTKERKLEALRVLSRQNFMRDLVPEAQRLLRDNRTTRGFYNTITGQFRVSRVKDLLKDIIAHEPQLPPNSPHRAI